MHDACIMSSISLPSLVGNLLILTVQNPLKHCIDFWTIPSYV